MADSTRSRILAEAMRLFGEHGVNGTSVAAIEKAAGLRPGSGGLYRHFPSKDALLAAGVHERVESRSELLSTMTPDAAAPTAPVLMTVAYAALDRLDDERDVSRILVRDLSSSPELLEFMRDAEIRTNHQALVALLASLTSQDVDIEALAAVLIDAISHYWLLRDVFGGEHPLGIGDERYLRTLVAMTSALIGARK